MKKIKKENEKHTGISSTKSAFVMPFVMGAMIAPIYFRFGAKEVFADLQKNIKPAEAQKKVKTTANSDHSHHSEKKVTLKNYLQIDSEIKDIVNNGYLADLSLKATLVEIP